MKYAFINAVAVFEHSVGELYPLTKSLFPQADKELSSQQRKCRLCLISLITFLFSNGSRPKAQPLRGVALFNQSWSHVGCLVLLQKHVLIFRFLSVRNDVAQTEVFSPLDSGCSPLPSSKRKKRWKEKLTFLLLSANWCNSRCLVFFHFQC